MTTALVVVGDLCVDLVTPVPGPPEFGQVERIVPSTVLTVGSSAAIVACGAARLGVATQVASVVGDDVFGHFLLDRLRDRGVDTTAIGVDREVPTGSSTILVLPSGDRSILTALGTIGALAAGQLDADGLLRAAHVHVSSYFLQYALMADLPAVFRRLRAAGVGTSVDPNYDPSETWDSGLRELLPYTDLLLANEQEMTAVAGLDDPAEAAQSLLALMPPEAAVVLKRGRRGAVMLTADEALSAAARPVTVVDTVGAGDTLTAGVLAARLRDLPPSTQLRWGVAAGTLSTAGAGGVDSQPDLDVLQDLAARIEVATGAEHRHHREHERTT